MGEVLDLIKKLLCLLLFLGMAALMIWLMYFGVEMLESIDEYAKNGTEEKCFVLDYEEEDCNCGSARCINQHTYSYTVISMDKCGNMTLFSEYDQLKCETENDYPIDEEHTCWIIDCQDETFTFNTTDENSETAWTLIIIAGFFGLCSIVGIVCLVKEVMKDCCAQNSQQSIHIETVNYI